MVDPGTLSKKERATVRKLAEPIPIQTANKEIQVTHEAYVFILELRVHVWAYHHEDTVAVLSLGLLCDMHGFTYVWSPNSPPTLTKGSFSVVCHPHWNVPFIYAGARSHPSTRSDVAGGNPTPTTEKKEEGSVKDKVDKALPAGGNPTHKHGKDKTTQEIIQEEMKGLEDFIPPELASEEDGRSTTRPPNPGREMRQRP